MWVNEVCAPTPGPEEWAAATASRRGGTIQRDQAGLLQDDSIAGNGASEPASNTSTPSST